jgi:ArsR family transcriptional regulator
MGSLSLIPAYSFRAALVIEQAWLSQQDDVQAIARKLASANCSGSGKAVCI